MGNHRIIIGCVVEGSVTRCLLQHRRTGMPHNAISLNVISNIVQYVKGRTHLGTEATLAWH